MGRVRPPPLRCQRTAIRLGADGATPQPSGSRTGLIDVFQAVANHIHIYHYKLIVCPRVCTLMTCRMLNSELTSLFTDLIPATRDDYTTSIPQRACAPYHPTDPTFHNPQPCVHTSHHSSSRPSRSPPPTSSLPSSPHYPNAPPPQTSSTSSAAKTTPARQTTSPAPPRAHQASAAPAPPSAQPTTAAPSHAVPKARNAPAHSASP